jgi:hypothetical protein
MNAAVRARVWSVLCEWFGELGDESILMAWRDPQSPGRQQVSAPGYPNYEMYRRSHPVHQAEVPAIARYPALALRSLDHVRHQLLERRGRIRGEQPAMKYEVISADCHIDLICAMPRHSFSGTVIITRGSSPTARVV